MQVSKWGDSLAIRIPPEIAEELHLVEGDEINVRAIGATEFVVECKPEPKPDTPKPTRAEIIEMIRQMGTPLPPDFKFSREEANDRGH
jgi:antitoxin MazE